MSNRPVTNYLYLYATWNIYHIAEKCLRLKNENKELTIEKQSKELTLTEFSRVHHKHFERRISSTWQLSTSSCTLHSTQPELLLTRKNSKLQPIKLHNFSARPLSLGPRARDTGKVTKQGNGHPKEKYDRANVRRVLTGVIQRNKQRIGPVRQGSTIRRRYPLIHLTGEERQSGLGVKFFV